MRGNFAALEASRLSRGATDPTRASSATAAPEKRRAWVRTDWAVFRGDRPVQMKLTAMAATITARELTKSTGIEHAAHTMGGRQGWRRHKRTPPKTALRQLRAKLRTLSL